MKRCGKCGQEFSVDQFYRNRTFKDGYAHWCKACERAYNAPRKAKRQETGASWYQRNKALTIARATQWAKDNPERFRETQKRCYRRHREARVAQGAAHYAAHRQECLARTRRWYRSHAAQRAQQNRAWRQANRHRLCEYSQKRRALQMNAPQVEPTDRLAIIARDRGICHICKRKVSRAQMSLDHLVPLSRGGDHTAANLAVAHRRCNSRRSAGVLPAQLRLLG